MKKIIALLLTALMLLAALPFASPPAKAEITFDVVCSVDEAYVGETFLWEVTNVQAGTGYHVQFNIYKDGELFSPDNYRLESSKFFTPGLPGKYKAEIWVADVADTSHKFSDEITVTANPNKITKIEPAGPTSLKITWNKVPGAECYSLYRTTNTAGWTLIADFYGTSFTDTNLKAGTRYFYQINYRRPGLYYNWFRPVAAGVPMGKSSITSLASPAKGRVDLVWSKAEGASGYQVLAATSLKGAYKPIRQLATGNKVTFTGLKSGAILYFKVKPYKRIYTTNYWGTFSAPKGIKVK